MTHCKAPLQTLLFSLILALTGCHYQTVTVEEPVTLSIPYIPGDREGGLTEAITFELSQSGLYQYVSSEGDVELQAAFISDEEEIVGFRYDRSLNSQVTLSNLMATENRRKLSVRVALIDKNSQEYVLEPQIITSDAEYDYIDVNTVSELIFPQAGGGMIRTIDFSEGQLDSIEGAQDSSLFPLYSDIAKKITALIERAYFENR
ncbi:LPS assembly lipoprotein LptE [Rhabdochlamydiaceae symbiont of Dictyostelium giganteum]|uniref:LPS assembly lipoprotein LptE n=1 Tax=Rhabdochlamydiaceae symbiont of Dictyostelium giganteum TaxID=3342349 RepID=UPI00384F174D